MCSHRVQKNQCGNLAFVDHHPVDDRASQIANCLSARQPPGDQSALSSLHHNLITRGSLAARILNADLLARTLQGQQVSHVSAGESQRLVVHFSNGAALTVDADSTALVAAPSRSRAPAPAPGAPQPSKRQFEYLAFIAKYIARYHIPPAEADIAQHFMVSAPSVNQMVQSLERRGFIARQPGVGRSIRICIDPPEPPPK